MNEPEYGTKLGTIYDRTMRSLHNIPDATSVKPTTIRTMHPVLELAQTFVVQTYRHREQGDTIFVEYLSVEGHQRIALLPAVADVIARQRDALGTKNRRQSAKQRAARDKAAGVVPGFMRNPGKRKKRKAKEGGAS